MNHQNGMNERERLQADLSCLIDGELDEAAAARALERLETSPECAEFFEAIRLQVSAHRDLSEPEQLAQHVDALIGTNRPGGSSSGMEARLLAHRLAMIFYQLGKAYTLAGTDPGFRQRVFENAVQIDSTRDSGRGIVEDLAARQDRAGGDEPALGGFDWGAKRRMFNGLLDHPGEPLIKARRLLEEALAMEEDHESAHLYLGFLDMREKRVLAASERFQRVFDEAIDDTNKGHAAMQLGILHGREGDYAKALHWYRWIEGSGLTEVDSRFFPVCFNIAVCLSNLGQVREAVDAFRHMLDAHPTRRGELVSLFAGSSDLPEVIERYAGFAEALLERCPELFRPDADAVEA